MTTYNGYTYDLSREEREANRKITMAAIQHDLQARTITLTDEQADEIRQRLQEEYDQIQIDRAEADAEYARHMEAHGFKLVGNLWIKVDVCRFHSGITATKEAEWLQHTQAVLDEVEAQRDARDLGDFARGG